jgi:hypothetical protein
MADNKNVQMSDEAMHGAAGGFTGGESKMPEYDAIGSVVMHLGGQQYQVRFDDGAELVATNQTEGPVLDGSKVGLFAVSGGWTMYVLANN